MSDTRAWIGSLIWVQVLDENDVFVVVKSGLQVGIRIGHSGAHNLHLFPFENRAFTPQADFTQLQQELGTLRNTAQTSEEALKRSIESNRIAFGAEIDRLRAQIASDEEEIGRLRAKSEAEAEEIGRLRSQVASADAFFGAVSEADQRGAGEAQRGGGNQQRSEGGAQDIFSQLFSKPPTTGATSALTWQQQELTRQQEPQPFFSGAPSRQGQPEGPASAPLTWQQQEMTRQQEPHHGSYPRSGGHFAGPPRAPVLHETDLAFAHQQRQLAQQRHFQGGQFPGHTNPPSAPQFPRFPVPNAAAFWDDPAIAGEEVIIDGRFDFASRSFL